MNTISGCNVSGKMTFTGGCDAIDGCTTKFEAEIYTSGCCDCECECGDHTTVNGLSGAISLTSPDDSIEIVEDGQDIELRVSGFEPLIPDPSTVGRETGKFWPLSDEFTNIAENIREMVVSGVAPAPGQTVEILAGIPNLNVVDANFWLASPGQYSFSMPIPHEGSGLPNPLANGRWTIYYEGDGVTTSLSKWIVTATSESADHSVGGIIWGIVRFTNI